MPTRPSALRPRASRAGGAEHHAVRAQASDQDNGQVRQVADTVGSVVAGVHANTDHRITGLLLPGLDQPLDDIA